MVRELNRKETQKRAECGDEGCRLSFAASASSRRRDSSFSFPSQPLFLSLHLNKNTRTTPPPLPSPRAAAALARARATASAPCSPCKSRLAAARPPPAAAAVAAAAAVVAAERTDGSSNGGGLLGPSAPLAAAELATGRAKASVALEEQGAAATSLKKELEAALGGLRAELAGAREARRLRRRGEGLAVLGAVSLNSSPSDFLPPRQQ